MLTRILSGVFLVIAVLPGQYTFHGVAVPPGGDRAWVVALDTVAVFRTTDFGQNWEPQELTTIRALFDVFFLDSQQGWTCGMAGDVWHTSNGGDVWVRQNLGGPKHGSRVRFLNEQVGWVAGGDPVQLRTSDGGGTWEMVILPTPPFRFDSTEFQGVCLVDEQNVWLAAGRFPIADSWTTGQGYIAHSTDFGENWQLVRRDTAFDFFDIHFADGQAGWVVGGDDRNMRAVVLHTPDGGATWNEQPVPPGARYLRGLCFVSSMQGWACGRNGTIIHTSDGGQTWVLQPTFVDTTFFDIEFADSLNGMAAGNSLVVKTTDGGQTWARCFGGVAEEPLQPRASRPALAAEPNPARGRVRFSTRRAGSGPSDGRILIHRADGRLVRALNAASAVWDGRNEQGEVCRAGVYVARMERDGEPARFVFVP
uniref:Photosynthesis system II assembly factor Ycf48/Hcf136-like domain-containing protein n=1 Tax=candidate division WOR-3 bacterium TaxID=2052148 RepID=A0A7C4CBE3_UNCW3